MRVKLYTPPAEEPITRAEVKTQVRVDAEDEDYYIDAMIKAIREDVQSHLGRALITQTYDYYLDAWPVTNYMKLPMPPLQSVTSITYTDVDGTSAIFSSSNYLVDTISEPGRIYLKNGQSWPSVNLQVVNPIVVRYVAGYGLAADVPMAIKQAMLLLAGTLFENRESVVVGNISQAALIGGAEALMAKLRIPYMENYG